MAYGQRLNQENLALGKVQDKDVARRPHGRQPLRWPPSDPQPPGVQAHV